MLIKWYFFSDIRRPLSKRTKIDCKLILLKGKFVAEFHNARLHAIVNFSVRVGNLAHK